MRPLARRLLLRGESWGFFEPVSGGGAEPGCRSGNGRRMVSTEDHVKPHLTAGDMAATQRIGPQREKADHSPNRRYRQKNALRANAAAVGAPPVELHSPFVAPTAARSHPDCRWILILIIAPQLHIKQSSDACGGRKNLASWWRSTTVRVRDASGSSPKKLELSSSILLAATRGTRLSARIVDDAVADTAHS